CILHDREERAVDAVVMLADFFEQDDMAGKIGRPVRADEMGEDGQVERGGSLAPRRWLDPAGLTREKGERARNGRVAALPDDVRRHRAVCAAADSARVKPG